MTTESKKTFSIGDAAKMTHVTQKQLRNWEAKNYIPTADRVVSGVRAYRRFTLAEVETIRKIKDYLDAGFTLAAAAQKATGLKFSTKGDQQDA
jgi:DNA-binding transcriptional MerR regulator